MRKERKEKLLKEYKVMKKEREKYVLSTHRDFEILRKCKELEKMKLSKQDKALVKFIKTQLERDWRKPVLKELERLFKKYR